ncbi:transposase, IS605 OrfB family, central region [Clostridium grantii DSM 8605]|uniref:Transposase, IS605 OrfB family, central region n=1 Tax=Clostridium grantii DSM 8605 TaxID=1121316 RepID=A0A1M5WR07_9CLOT|nr:transposase, IS605 OrfB family, central region [Clostridium grantii DSM 8605]
MCIIPVKITMKAMLINLNDEQSTIIDDMMLVFCTAMRHSFKKLLEGKAVGGLEKAVGKKYNLNIRQAKDAVESARQTISSQRELVKLNRDNYRRKVEAIEKKLTSSKKLTDKKRRALSSKLDKRKRKLAYFQKFIDEKTIQPVTFGTKRMFLRRCKGLITNKQWKDCRNNRFYSRGDKTKKGNPNLRVIVENQMTYLEISTLEKTANNRSIKIKVAVYLPQKLSKKTGKINGTNYTEIFLNHLKTGEAYKVELIKREGKYYCHITFELIQAEVIYTGHNGILGIDTNPDGLALTMIDNKGNYKWHFYLKQSDLLYARSTKRENLCGKIAKQIVLIAKIYNCGISIEDLKFKDDKDVSSKFSRIKHGFIYSKLLKMIESACYREGIEIVKVKPQLTSIMGLYKYCYQYGMSVHNGAAMVIARRSYEFNEKGPKILVSRFVKNVEKFNECTEWKKWSKLNKTIKEKVGENPGLWLANRKKILGLAN